MQAAVFISTTIDDLIQRIDKVKVCQEHLKLIAASLIRLRQVLNETNEEKDDRRSYEDIMQTLKAIDEVVASCGENETDLTGITYRDLGSLLLRLQSRVAQQEANMTNDYEKKISALSKAYYEQQILIQKVFDETIKQRLNIIEARTIENTKEQLRLLREKHFNTIKSYLHYCTEQHKSVPLTGLTSNTVAKVAQKFYHISSEVQIQLEHNWQSCELPLTRTFVQFKPDKSTSFERNESRRLLIGSEINFLQDSHSRSEASKNIWQRLVSAPYMMSMVGRNGYSEEEDVSEENILRTKRWIVILGDPGSGKTSFARWLVRHLAQTLLLNGQHSTDYGPLRIPILIRIGEFAEVLKEQPTLTLFEYIGNHRWMGKTLVDNTPMSLNYLSNALQDYIKQGQALIILDGLDEIPVSHQRSTIISVVENFVENYVQTPTGASALDNPHLNRLFDNPSESGGNQMIVTSRIVGYHAAPLAGQFAHYTIRPMDMEHMKDFVDYWFFRVHQQILDTLGLSVPNQGEDHGEALKNELKKTENIGLLDVASNSCLMSFICSVAFSEVEGSPLPKQRILLYEQIVNSMLSLWRGKTSIIAIPELLRILSDIATHIHEHSASGLIHEETMKEVCIQSIKALFNKPLCTEEVVTIESQACEFVRIIREDVGILAARGESLYGFLHLTFQEYFTCLKLVDIDQLKQEKLTVHQSCQENKVQLTAHSLRRHINDPRFRVPVALALGKISFSWSQKDFDDFCLEFIEQQDNSDYLLPLGAYMIINCSNDFVNYPSYKILFYALDCLIIAAGQHKWSVVCPFLIDQIRIALRKLRDDMVSIWINNFLSRSPSHDIRTVSAFCHLIEGKRHDFENIKWLNQSSCSMLQFFSTLDNENNQFAIDRLLVKIAFSNHRLLPIDQTTFKGFLITEEIEMNTIPVALFPLIITLYGGLKRDGQAVVFDPFHIHRESPAVTPILIRFLSRNVRDKRDQSMITVMQEFINVLLVRLENHDETCETVDVSIAIICLCGIDYGRDNLKIIPKSAFRKSLNRFKYISMILRQFYFTGNENDRSIENETTEIITILIQKIPCSEFSKEELLNLLNLLRSGVARLRSSTTSVLLEGESVANKRMTLYLPNSLRKEYMFLNYLMCADIEFYLDRKSCSLIYDFTKLFWILEHNDEIDTQHRMAVAMDNIPEYLLFRNDEDLLSVLTFVPNHLRNLYRRLLKQGFIMINSKDMTFNEIDYLYFGHILLECLMVISSTSCKRLSVLAALVSLQPMLRVHQLENFGSSLLWTLDTKDSYCVNSYETLRKLPMNYETGLYINKVEYIHVGEDIKDEERRIIIEGCIEQEHQRLKDALTEKDGRNMKLYSACISLASICRWAQNENRLYLLKESVQGAISIKNRLVRLDVLCMICFYSYSDCGQIQIDGSQSLQQEIEHQLTDIYSDLPLLLHTAILIRCLSLLQNQQMIDNCLKNLAKKFINANQQDQKVVYQALSPYVRSNIAFLPVQEYMSDYYRSINNRSSLVSKYFDISSDENLSSSLLVSNIYLTELASEFHKFIATDVDWCTIDSSNVAALFQFDSSILTVAQAFTITNYLSSISPSNQSEYLKTNCITLSNALHHFDLVEFKANRLLEFWIKWKDSNEFSSFAHHAALLLANSDLWSVEAATIVCDLLCNENDRFRQRAEIILRSKNVNNIRTSSKLGIDVLLILAKKLAHYQRSSPFSTLTLFRMFDNITIDIQSHLETFLWLERYRIHTLINKNYSLNKSTSLRISRVPLNFLNDIPTDIICFDNIRRMSGDLVQYMCDLITSNFSSFVEIDGDTTSNLVLESHVQFVASVLVCLVAFTFYTDETQSLVTDALMMLIETSRKTEIRRAAAYALGYTCDKHTYKRLFNKLQIMVNNETNDTLSDYDSLIDALISSYCHCVSVCDLEFDQDDIDLFCKMLKNSSSNVSRTIHVGCGRVLKNNARLFQILDSNYVQCYHVLISSTSYLFTFNVWRTSTNAVAEFIEEHPDLLSIFVAELYNSICHFTNSVLHIRTIDYYLAYGQLHYVEVAGSVAVRMPSAFCAYIQDCGYGDSLKRALVFTSKQHNYSQRAACITILSVLGEVTVELCEMIIEALSDDPHIQNTCYKCLTRIKSIKNEKAVLHLLISYMKSKSMNVRYITAKLLLHLSQLSLVSSDQVQKALTDLISDSGSNESLWLIEEQDDILSNGRYYYAGILKDVIYSLLIQHSTDHTSGTIRRNELNDIDSDFIESEKASRLASCLYEEKREVKSEMETPSKIKSVD